MKLPEDWKNEDRHAALQFFKSSTGQKILRTFDLNRPKLGGDNFEKEALAAREFKGFQDADKIIPGLISTPGVKQSTDRLQHINPNEFSGSALERA